MKRSRFTETQVVKILKQHEAGIPIKNLCKEHGISTATFYNWKGKYRRHGRLTAQKANSDAKRAEPLQADVRRSCPLKLCAYRSDRKNPRAGQ